MSNILITAIGSFSADIVIKNLKEKGHRIVGIDIYPREWVANSLQVDMFYQSPYASDRENYTAFINKLCKKEMIDYVIPLTDVEVDALADTILGQGILCLSSEKTIGICRDKYRLYQVLKEREVPCLISTRLFRLQDAEDYSYPLVLKPRNGRSSQGLHYVKNRMELNFLCESEYLDDFVVQPKKDGRIVTVDILRQGEFFMATPRVELLRTLNGAGTSVKVFWDKAIVEMARKIAEILDIRGCVNFEFIWDGNSFFFLECNPRFSGGVAFSCLAGYDYISNHLKCFSQLPLDEEVPVEEKYIARKYTEFITG